MSQQRNMAFAEPTRTAPNAIGEERILDAAYELMLAVGMRRMSMADIARRAGVSRATLYRRWPNVRAVVGALTTREFAALTAGSLPRTGSTARAGLVTAIVRLVAAVRVHPLLRKIIDVDPEFLLPYLLHRRGTSTSAQLTLLEAALTQGDESIRRGNTAALARGVWLAAWPFALTAPVLADAEVRLTDLDEQLHELLDRYLTP